MSKLIALFISSVFSLNLYCAIASPVKVEELTDKFISLIDNNDKTIIKNHFNIDSDSFDAIKENGIILLSNRDYVRYLFNEMDKLGLLEEIYSDPENRIGIVTNFSGIMNNNLVKSGLARLSTKDIRDIYVYRNKFYHSITDEEYNCLNEEYCNIKQKLKVSTQQFTCLTQSEIKNFFRIKRQAILSEINEYPTKRFLTAQERQTAGEILGTVLVERLPDVPPSEREIIINEMNSLQQGRTMSRTLISYMIECADRQTNSDADLIWLTFALEGL